MNATIDKLAVGEHTILTPKEFAVLIGGDASKYDNNTDAATSDSGDDTDGEISDCEDSDNDNDNDNAAWTIRTNHFYLVDGDIPLPMHIGVGDGAYKTPIIFFDEKTDTPVQKNICWHRNLEVDDPSPPADKVFIYCKVLNKETPTAINTYIVSLQLPVLQESNMPETSSCRILGHELPNSTPCQKRTCFTCNPHLTPEHNSSTHRRKTPIYEFLDNENLLAKHTFKNIMNPKIHFIESVPKLSYTALKSKIHKIRKLVAAANAAKLKLLQWVDATPIKESEIPTKMNKLYTQFKQLEQAHLAEKQKEQEEQEQKKQQKQKMKEEEKKEQEQKEQLEQKMKEDEEKEMKQMEEEEQRNQLYQLEQEELRSIQLQKEQLDQALAAKQAKLQQLQSTMGIKNPI